MALIARLSGALVLALTLSPLAVPPVLAQGLPREVREQVSLDSYSCRTRDVGFDVTEGYLRSGDFNGDGRPDYLIDSGKLSCSDGRDDGRYACIDGNCQIQPFVSIPGAGYQSIGGFSGHSLRVARAGDVDVVHLTSRMEGVERDQRWSYDRRDGVWVEASAAALASAPAPEDDVDPAALFDGTMPAHLKATLDEDIEGCRGLGGRARVSRGYLQSGDFDGDGRTDYLIDQGGIGCTAAASYYCGNSPCPVYALLAADGHRRRVSLNGEAFNPKVMAQGPVSIVETTGIDANGNDVRMRWMMRGGQWRSAVLRLAP